MPNFKPGGPITTTTIDWNVTPPQNFTGASYSIDAIKAILNNKPSPELLEVKWGKAKIKVIINNEEIEIEDIGAFLVGRIGNNYTNFAAPPCPPFCTQNI